MSIGSHQSARAGTVEWLTPKKTLDPLGEFDLDPCAPIVQPWPTAKRVFTILDDGLIQDWGNSRVWLNPPYSNDVIGKWLGRMADHDRGTALIFARTETDAFFRHVWEKASALLFLRGRLHFHYPDGTRAKANAGAPSVLCAYGAEDADVLAYCGIEGQFVPLRLPRIVAVAALDPTWRDVVAEAVGAASGPVPLADIYRAVGRHPKAGKNPHWREQVRKVLQQGPFERVDRGVWAAA